MSETTGAILQPETISSFEAEIPTFYGNYINVLTSLNDVRIVFGKHTPITQKFECVMYLSPQTAKQLAQALTLNIAE